jgi:carbon monoxide dehydrogenase subunit G
VTVIRNAVDIRCPPQHAFAYLSDLRSELDWNPACQRMEKLTDGPVGVGTRYRGKWKGGPTVEVEVVDFDPPTTWTAHNPGAVEVTFTCRLEPVAGGTRLTAAFDARPHGWFRLVFPLFLVMIRRQERQNMVHLRDALERDARVSEPPSERA